MRTLIETRIGGFIIGTSSGAISFMSMIELGTTLLGFLGALFGCITAGVICYVHVRKEFFTHKKRSNK